MRDRYSPDVVPKSIAGTTEIILAGNVAGDDNNWRFDISTGAFILAKKESGTWNDATKTDAPST
ncbi:hypothetical protein LCGC14_3148270 [marine sediment metagenome]|uniref:Uncharacterized protein n=1 Tax=marine sediment metagenome TaxID=412755 RepID=A0A0F8YJ52_9ZZZZ